METVDVSKDSQSLLWGKEPKPQTAKNTNQDSLRFPKVSFFPPALLFSLPLSNGTQASHFIKSTKVWERTMHPRWLYNKTKKILSSQGLVEVGVEQKAWTPFERLEEKLLWMCWEKEPSPFLKLSQCGRKAALWLPALWISTPALLLITSTHSPYLPSTDLDYREGMLSRETVKANEHRVKPVLRQWDTARG